jgi:imidazolonepropionase-like amidohydrolase
MATIFRNGNVIIGNGESVEKGAVAVHDNIITFVGPTEKIRPSKKDEVFDISGKSILPGLIDAHVHLCLDGSPDPMTSLLRDSIPQLTLKAAHHARETLSAGVTTIRDMGGKDYVDLAIRDGIESGLLQGPRMICSGRVVCMTGGQGWPFGREADGAHEVRKAVREQLKAGTNLIKLMATGGVMTPGMEAGALQLTYEELKAGVEEAHKAGRKAASHAQGNEGIKNSLRAGMDTIEHGVAIDEEAINLFHEKKAALVPTFSAPFHILEKGARSGIPDFVIEKTKRVKATHIESAQRAYEAGVSIGMGTDAGTPFNVHGENLKELELMMQLGFTAMEAIIAATRTAAEILGLGERIGTIEKGKLADFVVVDGNPVKEIKLLQKRDKILAIMKEGRFFKCKC